MSAAAKELLFLALGGSGEIGMNANLYGCDGKFILLDLGVSFGSQEYPGIDLIMPDMEWIEDRIDDLLAIVLTHGHEDHIGALPYLAADLGVPLYANRFTAGLIAGKLAEQDIADAVKLNAVDNDAAFKIGPFGLRFVPLAHSIPEMSAVVIDTPYGRIFHSGDWKLMEFLEDGHLELYHLRDDLGEKKNLVATMPDKAKELHDRLKAWRASVKAPMPTANTPTPVKP